MSGPQVDYVAYVAGRLAWLRRLAYLLCQDWHEADDLVQVTVTRLYMYWPRAARMDNIDAYARTILVRTFLGERRSAWFRRVLLPGSAQDQVPRLVRFREQHPDVMVGFRPPAWQAVIPEPHGETVITRYDLKAFLDKLDELLPSS